MDQRLVIGRRIRKVLTIEEIITIDKEGTDLDRVVEFILETFFMLLTMIVDILDKLRRITTVGVNAEIDAETTTCRTQGKGRTIATCQFF